jgi:hypothetical protein
MKRRAGAVPHRVYGLIADPQSPGERYLSSAVWTSVRAHSDNSHVQSATAATAAPMAG